LAWQDRDYYRGGGAGDYLSNPANILGFSIPFGTWLGVRVRLHFWLLVTIAFAIADLLSQAPLKLVLIGIALLLFSLLMHDFGHRFFAQLVGGRHDEFMLWPIGGLIFPSMPPGAWPMFVGHVGGIVFNLILAAGGYVLIWLRVSHLLTLPINPLAAFGMFAIATPYSGNLSLDALVSFTFINWLLVLGNLLPYFWFDGGFIWQSILWPIAGGATALNVTCIAGMILAVPMFFLSLVGHDFLGMVMWVLLFSSSFNARRNMQVTEAEPSSTGWRSRRWAQSGANRAAAKRKREEEKIDAILAKVSAHGMHSLTWWEKRTLKKGSERMR
jgi:stage IV sporulation protein FB